MYLHAVDNFSWNIPKVYRSRWQIFISQTNNSVCYHIVIVLDGVTKQQQPFMLIKKYLLG